MRAQILVAVAVVLLWAGPASAQVLSIEFQNGRVRLVAENVTVGRILGEWGRLGGTTIVNGDRIPGGPVSLLLTDVPERQALDVVLRGAAGYMVAARDATIPGRSVFDRILVLPTTARAPSAASSPAPQAPPPLEEDSPFAEDPNQPPPGFPAALRGRGQPAGPGAPPNQRPVQPEDDDAPEPPPQAPTRGNPFGVRPGTTRPGIIATPPPEPN
jgi:hypothetical protein